MPWECPGSKDPLSKGPGVTPGALRLTYRHLCGESGKAPWRRGQEAVAGAEREGFRSSTWQGLVILTWGAQHPAQEGLRSQVWKDGWSELGLAAGRAGRQEGWMCLDGEDG